MKFLDYVNDAQTNLRRSKLRTTLTVSALIIGTFTLSMTTAFTQGIKAYLSSQLHAYGQTNVIEVTLSAGTTQTSSSGVPYYVSGRQQAQSGGGGDKGSSYSLNEQDLATVKGTSGIIDAYPDYGNLNVNYLQLGSGQKYQVSVQPAVPGENTNLAAGSFPSASQPGIVLPYSYVEALGASNANSLLGQTITLNLPNGQNTATKDYRLVVSGVLPDTLHQANAYVSYQTISDMANFQLGTNNSFTGIIGITNTNVTTAQLTQIKNSLQAKKYSVSTYNDILQHFAKTLNIVTLGLDGFAGIALLAAMIGIVNTLLMAVFERIQEIGLLKALGMRRRGIFFQFLIEAGSIGFWGGVIGVALAMLLGRVANPILIRTVFTGFGGKQILSFPAAYMIGIIALGTIIGLIAGAFPALRGSRLDPIEALRRE